MTLNALKEHSIDRESRAEPKAVLLLRMVQKTHEVFKNFAILKDQLGADHHDLEGIARGFNTGQITFDIKKFKEIADAIFVRKYQEEFGSEPSDPVTFSDQATRDEFLEKVRLAAQKEYLSESALGMKRIVLHSSKLPTRAALDKSDKVIREAEEATRQAVSAVTKGGLFLRMFGKGRK